MNLFTKQKQTHRHRGQAVVAQEEGAGEGWAGESWIGNLGLADANLYIEWINNKVLLYSTGNYIQYPAINHNGKEYEKEYIYIYIGVYIYM